VTDYSVVIPAFNAEATIEETLDSVDAQTIAPEAVIVVDDGSTDGTAARVEAFGGIVRLVRQEHAGAGAATTRGLSLVETSLIATLDADDLWLPEKSARQIEFLGERPDVAAVFTQFREFRDGEAVRPDAPVHDGWFRTTMMVRTEAARGVGPMLDLKISRATFRPSSTGSPECGSKVSGWT
jgi:glycosyltransferase involved in cell wall biosynthesis